MIVCSIVHVLSTGELKMPSVLVRDARRLAKYERRTDLPMLVLSILFVALLVLPSLWSGAARNAATLEALEWLVWAVFAFDLLARLAIAPEKRRYLVTHWFDVAIVALPFLRPFRFLRVLRAVPLLARAVTTARRILVRRGLHYVLLAALAILVGSGVAVWRAEAAAAGASIQDLPDALWWAATTVTTVGYGDTYPTTAAGRGIGVALMLVGIALFGVITANVAAYFVSESGDDDHVDVAESLRQIERRLERIEALAGAARAQTKEPASPSKPGSTEEMTRSGGRT